MKRVSTYLMLFFTLGMIASFYSCSSDTNGCTDPTALNFDPTADDDDGSCVYDQSPTPYQLETPYTFGEFLPPPYIAEDNPLTEEGVALGRKLFYDPILSANGTLACGNCHNPQLAFAGSSQFPIGIDGIPFSRNTIPLFNVAWNFNQHFAWDGNVLSLEHMVMGTIPNPIGMHNTWPDAVASLQSHTDYPDLFQAAFGTSTVKANLVAAAIAQFVNTIISGNSKYDKFLRGELNLSPAEYRGFELYMTEEGDCFHCHGSRGNPLWTDNEFHNNGLDIVFSDLGLGAISGDVADNGKFKTPTLRNLIYTAPYMHDGRFETIDEVLEHYSTGVKVSPTTDPLMQFAFQGGVQLTQEEKADLKAFLLALTDEDFISNPDYQAP